MMNLEKLDNTFKELEIHANNFKNLGDIAQKIEKNFKYYEEIVTHLLKDKADIQLEIKNSQEELLTHLLEHKADIQLEIKNKSLEIQKTIELKLKEFFDEQSKKLKTLKILVFIIIIGLGIILAYDEIVNIWNPNFLGL